METHAPVPCLYYLQRIREIEREIIKQNIPKSSTNENSYENIEYERLEFHVRKDFSPFQYPIPDKKTERVHKSVPARGYMDSEESDGKYSHINFRVLRILSILSHKAPYLRVSYRLDLPRPFCRQSGNIPVEWRRYWQYLEEVLRGYFWIGKGE